MAMPIPDHDLRTPLTSTSQFIQAGRRLFSFRHHAYVAYANLQRTIDDDDDLDEDAIPGFSHPTIPGTPQPQPDKGKARAPPEQLAPPGTFNGTPSGQPPGLSGNIGSGSGGGVPRADRQTIGGVRVETRYVCCS
jgi:protein YIPF6